MLNFEHLLKLQMTAATMEDTMHQSALYILCFVLYALLLPPTPALSQTATHSSDRVPLLTQSQPRLAQGQCSRRVGPFPTQDTAWRQRREAQSQRYAVSDGVFPCYDQTGTRGYCFNIFFPC